MYLVIGDLYLYCEIIYGFPEANKVFYSGVETLPKVLRMEVISLGKILSLA